MSEIRGRENQKAEIGDQKSKVRCQKSKKKQLNNLQLTNEERHNHFSFGDSFCWYWMQ